MPTEERLTFDIGLSYLDVLPADYFEDFQKSLPPDIKFFAEPRENTPQASWAWVALTAVALYIGKPFIDAYLKRAADDLVNATYPAIKSAIINLAKKVLDSSTEPRLMIVTTDGKANDAGTLLFAIYAKTKTQQQIKFVFQQGLTDAEIEQAIEQLFAILQTHFTTEDDMLSRWQPEQEVMPKGLFLAYDQETEKWRLVDPLEQVREAARKRSTQP